MYRTDGLKRQHDTALQIATQLIADAERVVADDGREAAYQATLTLARLVGVLRIHLAQEDLHLYPALIRSSEPDVAQTAQSFFDEMGGIGQAFETYAAGWRSVDAVANDPESFAAATRSIVAALATRIERENAQLYPLADRLAEREYGERAA